MSDTEEENYCFYGTPLDPYDEDTFPKRKPIGIEEQIATDAQGRRRFHGAFTGGFSAGFFNTVGTPEGWTPSEFKSSRAEKASSKFQKPEDFMDDEDMGEFGFAPQTVKATDEFSTKKKRKKQAFSTGPIPGVPVLHTLLEIHTETIGYTLMKNMGWKVGGDDTDEEDNAEDTTESGQKVYGCVIPKEFRLVNSEKFTISANALKSKQPYEEFIKKPKDNSFGMGYSGLDRSIFGHVNLLEPSKLTVREKNNKRSTIRGQAFGVGAFEQEDEDIYKTDDMTKYDFTLEDSSAKKKKSISPKALEFHKDSSAIDNFMRAKTPFIFPSNFPLPTIPHSFTGKHKIKRSRFEPVTAPETDSKPEKKIVHNAETRAEALREYREKQKEMKEKAAERNEEARKKNLEMLFKSDRFVSSSSSENLAGKTLQTAAEMISALAPKEAAEDRKEDDPYFNDRFVSASLPDDPTNALLEVQRTESMHGTEDMRRAAKMKMFGALTRSMSSWNPATLLCKKFNVAPPIFDGSGRKDPKKRTKLLIFEYQKAKDAESDLKPGLTETKQAPETTESVLSESKEDENKIVEDTQQNDIPPKPAEEKPNEAAAAAAKETEEPETREEISPEKNMDLFKAVFLSSSSEDEEEPEKEIEKKEETHMDILTREISEVTSFPKIITKKIGILSDVIFTKPGSRNPAPPQVTVEEKDKNPDTPCVKQSRFERSAPEPNLYGPQLPVNSIKAASSSFIGIKPIPTARVDDDEWIEKDATNVETRGKTDAHKHKKKKHKKDSDEKRKKHKSKHKKHKKDKR